MTFQLNTPVAFLVFNRPDITEKVFEEIRNARPPKLLVVADGPRAGVPGEAKRCEAVRAVIDAVDWPCVVLTNYSDRNLGCKVRISTGIDWVFQHVEEAIILEDDCLPHSTFFRFCEELLEYYRHDLRIAQISGCNFQSGFRRNEDSYYFSKCIHIWGWASWRDRWQGCYDVNMAHWPRIRDDRWIHDIFPNPRVAKHWVANFEKVYKGEIDTWDFQWMFACWLHSRLAILPNVNLISNIGFGPDATHTVLSGALDNVPLDTVQFPLRHPLGMIENHESDMRFFKQNVSPPLQLRLKNKLAPIFCS